MSMVVLMVVLGTALVVLVVGVIWYVVRRGPDAGMLSRRDFDAAYDDRAEPGDREAAWRDFHEWQMRDDEERRSWDDPDDP